MLEFVEFIKKTKSAFLTNFCLLVRYATICQPTKRPLFPSTVTYIRGVPISGEATLSSAAGPRCGCRSQGLCIQSQIMYILWHGRHFVTRKNVGSINGCAMNGNLNALRVNLSVSNAQKVVVIIYFVVS